MSCHDGSDDKIVFSMLHEEHGCVVFMQEARRACPNRERMEGRKEGRKEDKKKTHRSAENCLLLHDLVLAHQAVVHQRHEEEQVRRRAAVAPLAAATGLGADRQLSQWPARNSDSATDSDNKTRQSELGRSTTTRKKHSPASSTPTRT
jgi:hypothetical protein